MADIATTHTLTDEELFCLRGCGKYPQYYRMRKGFEAGDCAFCKVDQEFNKVLLQSRNGRWMFWHNPFELKEGMLRHYLLVPRRHVRHFWELSPTDWKELGEIYTQVGREYGADLPGYGVLTRGGDMQLNAGTVPHLHINIYVPDQKSELRLPLFKKEEDALGNLARMAVFAIRYEAGELPA